jgi:hypothetical protein
MSIPSQRGDDLCSQPLGEGGSAVTFVGLVRSIMRLSDCWLVPGMGWGDLTDAEWERLRLFLPISNGRCGRWLDHPQVIDGILHRVRTGVQWRDVPERFRPWNTVYQRHRLWSADGTS